MPIRPAVVVLPAFSTDDYAAEGIDDPGVTTGEAADAPDEIGRWFDAYDLRERSVPGTGGPVFYDEGARVALAPTGIGKAAAATTVTALAAGDTVDFRDAHVVTVGIAGCPPDAGTVGSVFVADSVVDWDLKHRVDGDVRPLDWRVRDYVWSLDDDLIDRAAAAARTADLADGEGARAVRRAYDDDRSPAVGVGPTVCGDELWHGERVGAQVRDLCTAYGLDGYVTTEMEDAGTATALERFGLADRYVSVRAVSNFDRQPPGGDPAESVRTMALDLGVENAFRAGRRVVDDLVGE